MKDMKEFNLPVPWGHIAVKAWGSQVNFPVLCVHGVLDNAGALDRLIDQLPDNYYYVSIDLPGHGLSSHFPAGMPLDFFNYVLTIRYIVDELKWKTFYYMGHSLGAQLGVFFSIIYPDKIQKLILLEGFAPIVSFNKHLIKQIRTIHNFAIEAQNEKDHLYTRDEIMYTLKHKRAVCLNTDAAEAIFKRSVSQVGEMFKYNRDFRLKANYNLLNKDQLISIIHKLNVPLLLFLTTATVEILPEYYVSLLRDIVKSIKNSNIIILEGNHDIHNNHPEKISFDISKFLDNTIICSKL